MTAEDANFADDNVEVRRSASNSPYKTLDRLGRKRLSENFFFRDFLYSEIAMAYGVANLPEDEELAIEAGKGLCENLLEPLHARFGTVHIRSAYRSPTINALGNKKGHNCSANERNRAKHIWDWPDADGNLGATACIVIPAFYDAFDQPGDWTELAWWIHDHLPYNSIYFFKRDTRWAFNLNWNSSDKPERKIDSYEGRFEDGKWTTKRILTRAGMHGHDGDHSHKYARLTDRLGLR